MSQRSERDDGPSRMTPCQTILCAEPASRATILCAARCRETIQVASPTLSVPQPISRFVTRQSGSVCGVALARTTLPSDSSGWVRRDAGQRGWTRPLTISFTSASRLSSYSWPITLWRPLLATQVLGRSSAGYPLLVSTGWSRCCGWRTSTTATGHAASSGSPRHWPGSNALQPHCCWIAPPRNPTWKWWLPLRRCLKCTRTCWTSTPWCLPLHSPSFPFLRCSPWRHSQRKRSPRRRSRRKVTGEHRSMERKGKAPREHHSTKRKGKAPRSLCHSRSILIV